MHPSFAAKCRAASEWIQNGGLKEEYDVSQVEKESYTWLSEINRKGWLTIESQDGQSDERAYVGGFMKTKKAFEIVDRLNNTSDKILIILHPCNEWKRSYIPLTRHNGKTVTRQPIYTDTSIPMLKQHAGIAHIKNVCFVIAIDPTWNRKAYASHGLWKDVIRCL